MANMIRQGCSYTMIGDACGGRSEKAVRGVVFQKYHTENADKVRAMLGGGPWGTGAPEPTVKSEKHKETVRKPIARLCGLLLALRNSMDYGEYWQKDMCQHWNAIRGCTMHCTDCDSCTKFQRIRPQYCRMCGGEFLERTEQTSCPTRRPCGRNRPRRICHPCQSAGKESCMKKYIDSRGWKYQVMSGLGDNAFKARYQRPEKQGDVGWKGVAAVPWRESREEAQADLDQLAKKKGRKEWNG